LSVKQHFSPEFLNGRLVFVDIGQENKIVENMLDAHKQVILTCHAFPMLLHNVPQPKLIRNLELSTQIHFVSTHQRSEFIQQYPEIEIESKSFVIANYTRQGAKKSITRNIGIVGHLNREPKNGFRGIQLAHQSNANLIQCWGSDNIYGLDNPNAYPKLRLNGWTNSIHKMHKSFDVLLSTSRSETFGLVVVEALSAGIPCVLSDIPVYRELYSDCEGIIFLSGNDQQDISSINQLLDQSQSLKKGIIQFWQENFSDQVIRSAWLDKLGQLNTQQ
jgi:glycosyltransferase involved in cell wall biosynthesis